MAWSQSTSLWFVLALCLIVGVSNALDKVIFEPNGHHNAPRQSRVAPKGNHGPPKRNHGSPNETHIAPKEAPSTPRGPSVSSKPKQARPFFVFGDSLVDSGNNNHLMTQARADMPPYGIDSPDHRPTGRFSNGLNIPDIISEYIGSEPVLPYLSPELTGQKLLLGANFASAGVGIRKDTGMLFGDVLKMPAQLQLFEEYQKKLSLVTDEKQAKQLVNQALILVSLGGNDFINNYWRNPFMIKSLLTAVPDYVTNLISEYRKILEKLYELGARRVIVMGPGPLGCAPGERMFHNTHGECSPDLQAAASLFEPQLAKMVQDLNAEYHADVFIAANSKLMHHDLISDPKAFGFETSQTACCGLGPYNGLPASCTILSNLCPNRDKYVFWDAFHPTERACRIIVHQIMHGTLEYMKPMNLSVIMSLDSNV
uniref:GDSL esterase/lipase LTL1-like n=1 Tax=Erigeron canadensis TaxID=72917 RepID=UPI001CB91E40|nr:GDSL esterase/lipase LTL1-like [Erigeron canadensis]